MSTLQLHSSPGCSRQAHRTYVSARTTQLTVERIRCLHCNGWLFNKGFAPLLALIHDWHIQPVGSQTVLCAFGSWGPVCATTGTSTICSGSLLLHSFLQRLDLLLSSCCTIGVCAAGVHAVWFHLVKVLSESAFVWDQVRDQTIHPGIRDLTSIRTGLHDIGLLELLIGLVLQVVTGVRAPRCAAEQVHAESLAWHMYDLLQSSFRDRLSRNHLDQQPSPPSSVAQGYPRPLDAAPVGPPLSLLDRLYHQHLSLRLSCQDGWYLVAAS